MRRVDECLPAAWLRARVDRGSYQATPELHRRWAQSRQSTLNSCAAAACYFRSSGALLIRVQRQVRADGARVNRLLRTGFLNKGPSPVDRTSRAETGRRTIVSPRD